MLTRPEILRFLENQDLNFGANLGFFGDLSWYFQNWAFRSVPCPGRFTLDYGI